MKNLLLIIAIFKQILSRILIKNEASLNIYRAKKFPEIDDDLTPFVVLLTSGDQSTKIKPIDLICVVDISNSMKYDNRIRNAKKSLQFLLDETMEKYFQQVDKFALISFSNEAKIIANLTTMTSEKKRNNTKDRRNRS